MKPSAPPHVAAWTRPNDGVVWDPEASKNRDDIYDYIDADNPVAALALDELFEEKAGRLVDHPGLVKPDRVAGTREVVAH